MKRRPPWALPEEYDDPHNLWMAAREITDSPEESWTFPRFTDRVVASAPNGMGHAYEDLSEWDEVQAALFHMDILAQRGFVGRLGLGVKMGMKIFDSALRSVTGRLLMPTANDHFRGRHVVMTVGFDHSADEITFANSWGERWGDHGFGYLTRSYFEKHVDAVILARPTWIGPSPRMDKAERELKWKRGTIKSVDPGAYFDAWFTPNGSSRERIYINDVPHDLRHRKLYSFAHHQPFELIELRQDGDFRGRMHIVHDRRNNESTITEMWVPPGVRHRGYGLYL